MRIAALPAVALATVGVVMTAVLVGLAAQVLFGFTWLEGLLLGAIVAPTDAAAVFFLLRVGGITLRDRVRSTLEIESGTNDPMAIFLTLVAGRVGGRDRRRRAMRPSIFVARFRPRRSGSAAIVGVVGGFVIAQVVNRAELEAALYPIVVIAFALGDLSRSPA